MHTRKIQLIAGTTYTVSLPKEWVRKNKLSEKKDIRIFEKNDRTLVLSALPITEGKLKEISLNIDEHIDDISQVLFAVYYIGVEEIELFSKKELTKDMKAKVRKTLKNMVGTEISYEDKQRMHIKVLLDMGKVDITQTLYRISLLIESSISNMMEGLDIEEIRMNENEIDRLYHLIAKIVSLSLIDSNVLHSSKIENVSLIPAYFLIAKKLEHVADDINYLSEYLHDAKIAMDNDRVLDFARSNISRSINHIMKSLPGMFKKTSAQELGSIFDMVRKVEDKAVKNYLNEIIRHITDIQDEIVNISFYSKMIKERVL